MHKTIYTKKGEKIKVSEEDYEFLLQFTWHVWRSKSKKTDISVRSSYRGMDNKQHIRLMHRFIMGVTNPKDTVDHINFDTLDNRRENLRVVSQNENSGHRKKTPSGGAKGVYKSGKYYSSMINIDGKRHYIGSGKDKKAVAKMYNDFVKAHKFEK